MERIGPAGLALVWLAAGCATTPVGITAPAVHVMRIEPAGAKTSPPAVRVELRFQNANPIELGLGGFHFVLEIDGADFARGEIREPFALPAFTEGLFTTTAEALRPDVVRLLDLPGAARGFRYTIRGSFFLEQPERRRLLFDGKGRLLGSGVAY